MREDNDTRAEEIVIIRRNSNGEDEAHHGGVWKIAYADFMTAMMAFFLVMWLINAANTEVKASVASYFNPLRLTDSSVPKKGLRKLEGKDKHESANNSAGENPSAHEVCTSAQANSGESGESASGKNHRLSLNFEDPNSKPRSKSEQRETGAMRSGRAFRDPFNPLAPSQIPTGQGEYRPPPHGEAKTDNERAAPPGSKRDGQIAKGPVGNQADSHVVLDERGAATGKPPTAAKAETGKQIEDRADTKKSAADGASVVPETRPKRVTENLAQLKSKMASALEKIGIDGPGVDVRLEGNDVIVSLTDTSTFGMFSIGSADPRPELLDLMKSITSILNANQQGIVVRGHTDGRPFKGAVANNNWQLSMRRAQAAYELMIKAGVDESRFKRIEGYADRKLKDAGNPDAAANRRIEILLVHMGA